MEWVASTLHTTSEHGVSSITTADAHTSAASSRLNWRPPADLNGLVRFPERRNLVSARVPSHFNWPLPYFWKALHCIYRLQKVNYVYILCYAPVFCKVSPFVVVAKNGKFWFDRFVEEAPPHPIDKNRKKICLKIQISITKCNGERLVRGNGGEKVKSGGSSVESRRRQEERNTRKDKSERKEEECKKKNLLQGHRK